MAELDYAFLADYARVKGNSLDALSIGIDTIDIPDVPFSIQMVLVLRVQFDRLDCGNVHRIETIVQDPDGQRPAEVHINAQATWPGEDPPNGYIHVQMLLPLLIGITTLGVHAVEVALDGRHLKTIFFTVKRGESAIAS